MSSPTTKLLILSLDTGIGVSAQFNPKEFQIDKAIAWSKHASSKSDQPDLEFTGADGRSLSMELVFDGYEDDINVKEQYVDDLIAFASVSSSTAKNEALRRPQLLEVTWGKERLIRGVLESVATKYTMFSPEGIPIRCTVNLKFKEAGSLKAKASGGGGGAGGGSGGGAAPAAGGGTAE